MKNLCGALAKSARKRGPCQKKPGPHVVHEDHLGQTFSRINPRTRQPAPGENPKDRHAALYRILGRAILRERTALRLTQLGLSRRAGVARTTITRLEKGRLGVTLHALDDVATALNCSIADLLTPEKK